MTRRIFCTNLRHANIPPAVRPPSQLRCAASRRITTRQQSTAAAASPQNAKHGRPRHSTRWITIVIASYLGFNVLLETTDLDERLTHYRVGAPLNETRFIPFTITARDAVSPTSFVLTVRPKYAHPPSDEAKQDATPRVLLGLLFPRARFPTATHSCGSVLERAWAHGLWSVEVKQPQLQVARDYTPLPAVSSQDFRSDLERAELRFLIRRMDGGEVSTYLSRLGVGDTVELRGPHLGFDVRARLGGKGRRVVFLAGGTGIAPALQTVRAVSMMAEKPAVSILWANRRREDCPGIGGPEEDGNGEATSGNPIVSLLAQMKEGYGEKMKYGCTVDEEGAFIGSSDIRRVVGLDDSQRHAGVWSWWPTGSRSTADSRDPAEEEVDSTKCVYHSPTALASAAEKDPFAPRNGHGGESPTDPEAICKCVDRHGAAVEGGKNLLMVSGPEGFVTTFAGPKIWAGGMELQGPVGGVIGELKHKSPGFWGNWLVLKM
ncbi:hypothetical protein QBC47DRAFT_368702 [Echria macrotheca]|uniref:FAD-binding FR-type domain-containing protein n=1 Tax=Echria macrotheca TaxID=438768 RepID=A0AAJ0FA53_9PEZI|nr:hypothetical protein QBC47DRAFT_368702 [Echria macrotheca]